MNEDKKLSIFNTDKQISEEITFKNLKKLDSAFLLARTGIPDNDEDRPRTQNDLIKNRFEGLKLVLAYQQHIVSGNNLAVVERNCLNAWQKKHKEIEKQNQNPFNKEDNDSNELRAILNFLDACEEEIEIARRTKSFHDDFIWTKDAFDGEKKLELTPRFHKMFKELLDSYKELLDILITHNIITGGHDEDEEISYREQEDLFLERFKEA